jgi:hypothetical protein
MPTITRAIPASLSTETTLAAQETSSSIHFEQPLHSTSSPTPSQATTASNKSSALSGGAIAGIVIVILILLSLVTVFVMRKRNIFIRKKKRATWGGGIFYKPEGSSVEKPHNATIHQTLQLNTPLSSPPMSYNTADPVSAASGNTKSPPLGILSTVKCTFIPNLPDELSISTGELIRILVEYDDGWALCANMRGEQGVVPLECLEKKTSPLEQSPDGSDWRNARRASSLNSPGQARY